MTMPVKYRWKDAPHVGGVPAQKVGEALEQIRRNHNGRLTSKDVLDEARKSSHPLHKAFEWDDGKAAERWRLEQAGQIIRSIEIVVEIRKGDPRPLRAFVSVTRDNDRSYTSLAHAMSDEQLRAQVISSALTELQSWRERYSNLSEFAKVFAAIDKTKMLKVS
jgi:hypothetical protein